MGTIGVLFGVPFGTQSTPINVEILKKVDFYDIKNRHNGTQNVEWYPNGTQNSTQVVPKLSDAFYRMINFHHFWSPKNGSKATLTMILGTIPNFWVPLIIFFGTHTM